MAAAIEEKRGEVDCKSQTCCGISDVVEFVDGRVQVLQVGLLERRKPLEATLAAEHRLEAAPAVLFAPLGLLLFERLDLRFIREDGRYLRAEHDQREDAEEQGLEAEQNYQDERGRWREVGALCCPVGLDALDHVKNDHDGRVKRY